MHRLNKLAVPALVLVRDGCFGGGTGTVAACDVLIAADADRVVYVRHV